ncbi:MAG: EAL domain-containing protein [Acidobacteriaceae bacterium]|jgi:diguanylate cyclase (GGDEF)-like protein
MRTVTELDRDSNALARDATLISVGLAVLGSGVGVYAVMLRVETGLEVAVAVSSGLFGLAAFAMLYFRKGAVDTVGAVATCYYGLCLCGGVVAAVLGHGKHVNLFTYLLWFFPLLVFNKLVNAGRLGHFLGWFLLAAPLTLLAALAPQVAAIFPIETLIVVVFFGLTYVCFALALNAATRYREAYIVERERAESLRIESAVLESISDCFISVDTEYRLVYINDAAAGEFGIERHWALKREISAEVSGFFSASVLAGLQAAARGGVATTFEAQIEDQELWYVIRCFPRPERMSIFFRNITEAVVSRRNLEAAAAKTHRLAFYDFLTELPNRVLLRERMEDAMQRSQMQGTACALMLIDLDDFKTLNDTAGHDVGDILLQEVARRILGCVRKADTAARFGGDEFVVMLEGLSGDFAMATAEAQSIGAKILRACQEPIPLEHYDYEGTTSVGVTVFRGTEQAADQLLKQADLAMYRAKSQGRNAVCFFDTTMEALVRSRATLLADLKRAMQNGEFELHYQPQLDGAGRVTGAEALLRWRHPLRGLVAPSEFIPVAEAAGLINGLGEWALQTACEQLRLWARRPELKGLSIAVNVSVRQFQDSGFVALVRQLLFASGVNPRRLKLEITESFMVERANEAVSKMVALKALGIGLSMDDFGTGYSSLSQLKRLPLDQLKIDHSFVQDLLNGEKDASILNAIVALAQSLKLSLIVEGVETEEQLEFLQEQGCNGYQGFLFSAALTSQRFEMYVEAREVRREGAA